MKKVKILAVADPAVYVYVDKKFNILDKFREQTGVEVSFDIVPWVDYYSVLMDSFKEYKYDIVMVAGHLWLRNFVNNDYLHEIKNTFNKKYDYDDIIETIRCEMQENGKRYLLPSFCDGHILLYRKSQVNRVIKESISIDELIDIIKENDESSKNTFVIKAHESEIFTDLLPYLRSEGIEPFSEKGEPLFNTPKGYKALEKYIELKKYCTDNVSSYGNTEVLRALQEQKCKLGVSWGGQLGQIMNESCHNPEDIGFAALDTSWNVTWSFGINKLSQNESNALRFLEFITSKDIDRIVGGYCGNPTRKSSFIKDQDKYNWYPVVLKMIENSKPLPKLGNISDLIGIMTEEIVSAFAEEVTPKEALQKAFIRIKEL